MLKNQIVEKLLVYKFYYKGTHSHPIRRTVLILKDMEDYFCGYELREGKFVRNLSNAPVKNYTKSKVATLNQLRNKINSSDTTLRAMKLVDLMESGL